MNSSSRLEISVHNLSPVGVKITIEELKELIEDYRDEQMLSGCIEVREMYEEDNHQ